MISQDSIWKDKGWWKLLISLTLGISIFIISMNQFVIQPEQNQINKEIADDKAKTQAEHNKIVSMDCKALGDWLLQDDVWSHDNLIWAQNHYLVSCK